MGTSTSSKGPKSNVPLNSPGEDTQLAPSRRFSLARKHLGEFSKTGDTQALRAGISSYVVKGYKNPQIATQRMKKAVVTATKLFGLLVGEPFEDIQTDLKLSDLEGKNADEIIDKIIETVCPTDGSLDSESMQKAIHKVLSKLVDSNPDVDLANLGLESATFVVEKFISEATFNRINLDIGQHVQDNVLSAKEALSRLREMKEYVEASVKQAFTNGKAIAKTKRLDEVNSILNQVIVETLEIFQDYIK